MNNVPPGLRLLLIREIELGAWWSGWPLDEPFWRLYWHDTPGATLLLPGGALALEPRRLHLVRPRTSGSFRCHGKPRQFHLHFLVSAPFAGQPPGVVTLDPSPSDEPMVAALAGLLGGRALWGAIDPAPTLLAGSLILNALARMPGLPAAARVADPRVQRVLDLLDAGGRQPANRELADVAGMATNSFGRLFRAMTGESPQGYALRRRLEQAAMRLEYTGDPLPDIAEACGFADRYHFGKAFKAAFDEAPGVYRQRRQAFLDGDGRPA